MEAIEPKKRKQSPSRISEAQHNLIIELKDQGLPNLTVAKKVGVSSPTVRAVYYKKKGFVEKVKEGNYKKAEQIELVPVDELDFEKEGGFFCIDKWDVYNRLGKFHHQHKTRRA